MQEKKTQQFARFFLKDLKTKRSKYKNQISDLDKINFSAPK
tara:strand:+ start:348 stop:470 length:123 start_codon:yes stop_codon:yes gene_type:complete